MRWLVLTWCLGSLSALAEEPLDALTLERTACSGDCPVYSLTITRDGRVHFVGVEHVGDRGEHDWRVDALYVKHLFGELERSGFEQLGPRFPTEVEEFPGLVLTWRHAGAVHRVQLGGDGTGELPRDVEVEQRLKRLATLVDKLTASGRFVEQASKKKAGGCVDAADLPRGPP